VDAKSSSSSSDAGTPWRIRSSICKEKIVATGDLNESQIAYMGDAQFDEWVVTLEALKKLDFETDLPGHGMPFKARRSSRHSRAT